MPDPVLAPAPTLSPVILPSVVAHLRRLWADEAAIAAIFGSPLRLFEQVPHDPVFPYLRLVRSEWLDNGADRAPGAAITLTFNLWGRHHDRDDLQAGMARLIAALDSARGPLEAAPSFGIVIALPILADFFYSEDNRFLRGVLRLRVIVDPIL